MGRGGGTKGGGASARNEFTGASATGGGPRYQVTATSGALSWDSSGRASRTIECILSSRYSRCKAGSSSWRAANDAGAHATVAYDGAAGIVAWAASREGAARPGGPEGQTGWPERLGPSPPSAADNPRRYDHVIEKYSGARGGSDRARRGWVATRRQRTGRRQSGGTRPLPQEPTDFLYHFQWFLQLWLRQLVPPPGGLAHSDSSSAAARGPGNA